MKEKCSKCKVELTLKPYNYGYYRGKYSKNNLCLNCKSKTDLIYKLNEIFFEEK